VAALPYAQKLYWQYPPLAARAFAAGALLSGRAWGSTSSTLSSATSFTSVSESRAMPGGHATAAQGRLHALQSLRQGQFGVWHSAMPSNEHDEDADEAPQGEHPKYHSAPTWRRSTPQATAAETTRSNDHF